MDMDLKARKILKKSMIEPVKVVADLPE